MKSNRIVQLMLAHIVLIIPVTKAAAVEQVPPQVTNASLITPKHSLPMQATFLQERTFPKTSLPDQPAPAAPSTANVSAPTQPRPAAHRYDAWFMLLAIVVMAVTQLRRKQNALPHHPLSVRTPAVAATREPKPRLNPVVFKAVEEAV